KDSTRKNVPICGLASRYRELSLLQLKYEHLIDVCSALLRPWPSEDTASVLEGPKSPFDSSAKEPPATSEPDVNPELQALEHVLNKAHKVRAECTTAVRKPAQQQPKVSFAASMRLATSVYNQSGKKAQPSKTHSHKKKSSEVPGKKQRILPAIVPASVSKVASEQRSPPKADTRGGSRIKDTPADTRGGSRIKDTPADTRGGSRIKDTPAQLQGEEYCHTLKTHGVQLSMPSSYCNLQKRFSRISGHINSMSCSSSDVVAGHFVNSLIQRRGGHQALEGAHLQLLREGYTLLKDQLYSQEASDSGSWLEVKQQLDLIQLHYSTTKDAAVLAAGVPFSQPSTIAAGVPFSQPSTIAAGVPYSQPSTIAAGVPFSQPSTIAAGVPFSQPSTIAAGVPYLQPSTIVYSTTKEWLEMATCKHRRQLQHLELEILKICREHLLPKLSSIQHEDVSSFTETKRLLHTVLGMDAKPTISEE
ncbi:hypothetical protein EMCRGX_G028607, partial [Ephydatia muelleri]